MSFSNAHQAAMKQQSKKGRCLHFKDGARCNEIIAAHSIQKQGQLRLIAESGHVYRLNSDISTLKESGGIPLLKKTGVNRVSTFAGMCKHHDNQLFEPIDNKLLTYDYEQVALYAYRSICREYFVKENAVATLSEMRSYPGLSSAQQQFLQNGVDGHLLGFERLRRHKNIYDASLADRDFSGFKFAIFGSTSRCSLQASGLIFPDFDFKGRLLQHLGLRTNQIDLLTFFTAPTECGWALVLAWHESSDESCLGLMQSLVEEVRQGSMLEDMLLRFSLTCCENHAIRMSWWDELPESAKKQATDMMAVMADPTVAVTADYLTKGCEGLADWSFDRIQDAH